MQLALAYPEEGIIVLATRRSDAKRLHKHIRKRISKARLAIRSTPSKMTSLLIATHAGLNRSMNSGNNGTILLCVNPTECTARNQGPLKETPQLSGIDCPEVNAQMAWMEAANGRLFGFLPESVSLSPQQVDFVSGFFGDQAGFIPVSYTHLTLPTIYSV